MVNIKKFIEDDLVVFEVKGHAQYAKFGKDIVCASVSTLVVFTSNLILNMNPSYNIQNLKLEEGYSLIKITNDETYQAIIKTLDESFSDLANTYPKYIKYNR